ncbi:unnamed protein product [Larinioides sclopetarius]|uniref:Uncharacterized protein n=1 Tax=Larinioides sclopetarius TaxID=280406 RepID=A0AAV1ZR70_9ARAC
MCICVMNFLFRLLQSSLYRKNMKHMKLGMMTFMLCLIQKQV